MRMLVTVYDKGGIIKLCWYGSPSITTTVENDLDIEKCFQQQSKKFIDFINNKDLICKLEKKLSHLGFYTEATYSEINKIRCSNKKADIEYCNLYDDSTVGVGILDNIAESNHKEIKTFSHLKYINDVMFTHAIFTVNFNNHTATIQRGRSIIKSINFEIASPKNKSKYIRKSSFTECMPNTKRKRGGPKKIKLFN